VRCHELQRLQLVLQVKFSVKLSNRD
jgi:hypothetical protein